MTTPLDIFQEQLCEVIDRIRDNGACSIVLRTPNPRIDTMLHLGTELAELPQKDGKIVKNTMSSYAQTISRIAEAKKTLLVDHYSLWKKSMESSCRGDFLQLMNDPTHPNTIGHRRLYHELAPIFNGNRNFYYEWERLLRNEGDIA
jgi:lysophospholipase L1-like esterase